MVRTDVDTPLGPIAVHRHGPAGGTGPALLLWHSLFVDGASWDAVLPALSGDRSAEAAAYVERAVRGPGRAPILRAMRSVAIGRPPLLDRLPAVRCPTLLVATDGSALWTPAEAERQAKALPDGRVEVMKGVGHLPPVEAPAATAALINRWLSDYSRSPSQG